jgi:hypothetical protein
MPASITNAAFPRLDAPPELEVSDWKQYVHANTGESGYECYVTAKGGDVSPTQRVYFTTLEIVKYGGDEAMKKVLTQRLESAFADILARIPKPKK